MEITTLILGMLQTNCYIVFDGQGAAVVIDPGAEPERIFSAVRKKNAEIRAVLLTHGHFDHVGAVRDIARATGCPVLLDPLETTMPLDMTGGPLYYTDAYGPDDDTMQFGKLIFAVLHTPGHTPGSVCLRCRDALFVGDTLFLGSCGRTDLPGGDPAQMRESLSLLAELGDLRVFPGHGERTTLDLERRYNPFMRDLV